MKKLSLVHQSSGIQWVGDGFPVRSVFSYDRWGEILDPFLLLDYVAPYSFEPTDKRRGVGAHPHRGFETVTLALQGEVEHRDTGGGGGRIGPGDVQWMTAGSGLLHEEYHSENFARRGGMFEMVQLWINLPAKDKGASPAYQTLLKANIPVVDLPGHAGTVRVIAGDYQSHQGPAKTFTPINLWEIQLPAGAIAELPASEGHTTMLMILRGGLSIDGSDAGQEGSLAIFDREGEGVRVTATTDSHLLLLSGQPLNEAIVGKGPFVMNSEAEIRQAYRDFHAGRMGAVKDLNQL